MSVLDRIGVLVAIVFWIGTMVIAYDFGRSRGRR